VPCALAPTGDAGPRRVLQVNSLRYEIVFWGLPHLCVMGLPCRAIMNQQSGYLDGLKPTVEIDQAATYNVLVSLFNQRIKIKIKGIHCLYLEDQLRIAR
jgi:hypothetical protein